MREQSLEERLKAQPILKNRIEAILDVVEDICGEVEKADEAERRMIEEVRQLGNEALGSWAERKVEEKERVVRGPGGAVKGSGKKNCAGTQRSAR